MTLTFGTIFAKCKMKNKPTILLIPFIISSVLIQYSNGNHDDDSGLRCETFHEYTADEDPIENMANRLSGPPLQHSVPTINGFNGPISITGRKANTTNKFATLEDLKYYNYYAYTAYCPFDKRGYVKLKECNPTPAFTDTTYCETIKNRDADTFVMLSWNKGRKEIIAAFRGTRSPQNVFLDIQLKQFGSEKVKDLQVHLGFFNAARSIYKKTVARLRMMVAAVKPTKITFTGHSLGGAMAAMVVGMIKVYGDMAKDVPHKLITYGMPRVGNDVAVDYVNKNYGIELTRVVANADIVPHIPTVFSPTTKSTYLHYRNEVWINGDEVHFCTADTYEDKNCSNSLDPGYKVKDHAVYFDVTYPNQIAQHLLPMPEWKET